MRSPELVKNSEKQAEILLELPDGTISKLNPSTDLYRTFEKGDGKYDHLVHIVGKEMFCFPLTDEIRERVESEGYLHTTGVEPDEEALVFYAAYLEEGLERLRAGLNEFDEFIAQN